MTKEIEEFQSWVAEFYPNEFQFPKMLRYWLNKYEAERYDPERISYKLFKDTPYNATVK